MTANICMHKAPLCQVTTFLDQLASPVFFCSHAECYFPVALSVPQSGF